jgi:N-acetylated-alpha-linked acidic dipeptidase
MATALMRMADAPLLPFEFLSLAKAIESYTADLLKNKTAASKLDLTPLKTEVERLRTAAAAFEKASLKAGTASDAVRARVNQALLGSERAWLIDAGLPGRPFYKHQLVAPGTYTGYSAKTLPGVREAADAGRWDEANAQVGVLAGAIRAVTAKVDEAARVFD